MFRLLKYLNPSWYYNLKPEVDPGYFPDQGVLADFAAVIPEDKAFSKESGIAERSYRAFRCGVLNAGHGKGLRWWENNGISLEDEYRFARRHFPSTRVTGTFLLRIFSLNDPFKEISAFLKSTGIKKITRGCDKIHDQKFREYQSSLVSEAPLVSVIIPTLNRYKWLENVLKDFEVQDYKNFEIIIIDQSDNFQPDFYKKFKLSIHLFQQQEKALWLARNTAVKKASGRYLAFSEDDVRIPPDWISNHLKCIDYFNADISAGVFFPQGSRIPAEKSYFRWAEQFATGNALLKKEVFSRTGLFDRQFEKQRMGDGEFGLRAYLAGFRSVSNPFAWCEDLKASVGGLRQSGAWDAFRPKHFWSPRPVPSVLYFYRKYFGKRAALYMLFYHIPPSLVPYRYRKNAVLRLTSSLLAILLFPLILFQISAAWSRSTAMLRNPKIELLDE